MKRTLRLRTPEQQDLAADDIAMAQEALLRPSIRLPRAARLLDCDKSTLYKALKAGQLEGHRLNRTHRIFLDSLRAWQQTTSSGRAPAPAARPRRRHDHPELRTAIAELRAMGVKV